MTSMLTMSIPAIVVICGYFSYCKIEYNLDSISQIFKGALTDDEFDAIIDIMFADPNFKVDTYRAVGGGYEAWIANSYYGFSLNDVKNHTPKQKRRFFKRLEERIVTSNLKVDKLRRKLIEDGMHKVLKDE